MTDGTMKIGILVERIGMYFLYGSVIDEAMGRGHEVICLHNYSQPRVGPKGYQFPSIENVPSFRSGSPTAIPFERSNRLVDMVKEHNIDTVLSGYFNAQYSDVYTALNKGGVVWGALQHSFDTILFSEYLGVPDRHFMYSGKWFEWALEFMVRSGTLTEQRVERRKEELRKKVLFSGFTMLDQVGMINPIEVREEWGIPEDMPVVLFLPFDFRYVDNRFYSNVVLGMNNPYIQIPFTLLSMKMRYIKHIMKGWNDYNVAKAIKRFCVANDAYLLVKVRNKSPAKPYLYQVADRVVYDGSYYPADLIKCLSISDVCINYFSTAVTAIIPSGVSNICILPDAQDIACSRPMQILAGMYRELFDFSGASYTMDVREAVESLPNKSIDDYPLVVERQKDYVRKFLSASDRKVSSRILNELEKLEGHEG